MSRRRTRLSSATITRSPAESEWILPSRGRVGMFSLIAAESAIFTIFVVAYIFYIGKSLSGPTPKDVLETSDLQHDLPALQQSDDSSGRDERCAGQGWRVWIVVVRNDGPRHDFPGGTRAANGTT